LLFSKPGSASLFQRGGSVKQEKLQMYFKIEIFNAMGSKVHELVVKSERKNDCQLEALRWIHRNLYEPEKCTYKIS
jgi:hypothetical protein